MSINTTKAIGHHANRLGLQCSKCRSWLSTHTIGFTFTACHAFSVTNQNPLMSVEETRQLLSKAEMRKAIADEAIDEITNDQDPSKKLDSLKFYADHFVEEMIDALEDGSVVIVVIQEVETKKC